MHNGKTQYASITPISGARCHFEKNGSSIQQVVDKMFNDKAVILEKGGETLTILQSGHLGCTNGGCVYNKLFGEPVENGNGKREFRYCKLLEVDPASAMSLDGHVRSEELVKMLNVRDASMQNKHPGWKNLEKYAAELEEINKSEKK